METDSGVGNFFFIKKNLTTFSGIFSSFYYWSVCDDELFYSNSNVLLPYFYSHGL